MIEQCKKYTTQRCESSGRGEIFRAVVLCRQATQLLKSKASQLPDCPPGTRLQTIAARLGDFSNSLERVAVAVERGHHRKSPRALTSEAKRPRDARINLSQLDSELTKGLRRMPIGSRKARQLYALRARVREELDAEELDAALCDEGEPSVAHRGMTECTLEHSVGGAA